MSAIHVSRMDRTWHLTGFDGDAARREISETLGLYKSTIQSVNLMGAHAKNNYGLAVTATLAAKHPFVASVLDWALSEEGHTHDMFVENVPDELPVLKDCQ